MRFAEKLDNDDSLDSIMRERIEHNLKYNDDTIFENISIFRDLNNSGILLLRPKLKQHKEAHPLLLSKNANWDEEDKEENKEVISPIKVR